MMTADDIVQIIPADGCVYAIKGNDGRTRVFPADLIGLCDNGKTAVLALDREGEAVDVAGFDGFLGVYSSAGLALFAHPSAQVVNHEQRYPS